MKNILFLTGYASPYKVNFFDTLALYANVTVLLSEKVEHISHRDPSWFVAGSGKAKFIQLEQKRIFGRIVCPDVISWLKKDFDKIVICGYSKLTDFLALGYLKMHRIPYAFEVDGGLIRQDGALQKKLKNWAVSGASLYLSSGRETTRYLVHYGADPNRVKVYPFASYFESDMPKAVPAIEEKLVAKKQLGMLEDKILLSIGQFIPRKGFDVLLNAAVDLPKNIGIYIVGSEPTEEYLQLRDQLGLSNVHFVGFCRKQELAVYYTAADLFVLPTREDIWGLVVNEAMSFGLPVVTTDRCVAGLELVRAGENGYIVPVENVELLAAAIKKALDGNFMQMGAEAFRCAKDYTIENMAKVHAELLI